MNLPRALLTLALTVSLSACFGGPPGVDGNLVDPKRAAQLQSRIREGRASFNEWRELIDILLASGDPDEAWATAKALTDAMPSDTRAWLLRANVARAGLLLTEAEASLRQAMRTNESAVEPVEALASLFAETRDFRRAAELRRKAVDLLPQDQKGAALVRLGLALSSVPSARAEMVTLAQTAPNTPAGWLLRLRAGQPIDANLIQEVSTGPKAELPERTHLLCRLVSLTDGDAVHQALAAAFQRALADSEDPAVRFAALFGSWQLVWARSRSLPIHGVATGAPELASRLDEIDPNQPDWATRAALAANLSLDPEDKALAAARLARLGLSVGPRPTTVDALLNLWAAEDAIRLGLHDHAVRATHAARQNLADPSAIQPLTLALASSALESGRFDAAIDLTSPLIEATPPIPVRGAAKLIRWHALTALGRAKDARSEIEASQAASEPPPASPQELAWLLALIRFAQRRA